MKYQKGFTLIELLVVIAIIGIISSVVIASLSNARDKSDNATIKHNMSNMRPQAELFYASAGTYQTLCLNSTTGIKKMIDSVQSANGGTSPACNGSSSDWAVQSVLKIDEGSYHYWCVDSKGTAKGNTSSQPLGSGYVCP